MGVHKKKIQCGKITAAWNIWTIINHDVRKSPGKVSRLSVTRVELYPYLPWDPREQGAWPKIREGPGSKENVIWEQGAQKSRKGSREQQKIGKWSKEQEKLSGSKRKNKKRSREQREMKKEQSKLVKRSEHRKMEGSRENGVKWRRTREHRPPNRASV